MKVRILGPEWIPEDEATMYPDWFFRHLEAMSPISVQNQEEQDYLYAEALIRGVKIEVLMEGDVASNGAPWGYTNRIGLEF